MTEDVTTYGVRAARPDDVPEILAMIQELADYERAPHEVVATADMLQEALFSDAPAVFGLVVEPPAANGAAGAAEPRRLAAFALWFRNFSTWTGRHGVYLEDLYVRPEMRSRGYGVALLRALAHICVERGYTRLEWSVLDWNEPALGFYRSLGAVQMDEWTVHRVAGDALARLAEAPSA